MEANEARLSIALVGCGQIADAHLQEIGKISGTRTIAVCDHHLDLARQAAARFAVPRAYDDLERLLATERPDVLHIATPPQTHLELALQAIAAGSHLYIEKPFALDVAEADRILVAADAAQKLVCIGHDHLFDPIWLECRALCDWGRLGTIVHVDSVQGYDLNGPFGKGFTSDPDHWLHRLPGGLFQNVISHALYRITEFLTDDSPRVWATWFGAGGSRATTPTELRVMLRGADVTASLMFSSAMRPVHRLTRIYGTKQGLEVDLEGRTIRTYRRSTTPGAFAKIESPLRQRREASRYLRRNIWKFLRSDIHYFAGMNQLFTRFYRAVREDGEPPIPYREVRRVTALMDQIFRACRESDGLVS